MLDAFTCDESGVLIPLSILVRKRMYLFKSYNAGRYDVVVEKFLHE